jgi:hypothetical protein
MRWHSYQPPVPRARLKRGERARPSLDRLETLSSSKRLDALFMNHE